MEYGPYAFFVSNPAGHRLIFIAENKAVKDWWFSKLEYCPEAIQEKSTQEFLKDNSDIIPGNRKIPPPPPPRQASSLGPLDIAKGWVKLHDNSSNKPYYYNEELGITQWERPE